MPGSAQEWTEGGELGRGGLAGVPQEGYPYLPSRTTHSLCAFLTDHAALRGSRREGRPQKA
jgi:hypothetical protein